MTNTPPRDSSASTAYISFPLCFNSQGLFSGSVGTHLLEASVAAYLLFLPLKSYSSVCDITDGSVERDVMSQADKYVCGGERNKQQRNVRP